jgi:hypothetical protein
MVSVNGRVGFADSVRTPTALVWNKSARPRVAATMPESVAPSKLRRVAGSALLLGSAGVIAAAAVGEHSPWTLGFVAALVAAAAVGISHRSVLIQFFSRGIAWFALTPTALAAILSIVDRDGSTEVVLLVLAAAMGGGLFLARPMLHTESARREFAPVRFRRLLMAGAVSSVATGIMTAFSGVFLAVNHSAAGGLSLVLAGTMLASAHLVARMRSFGLILGMANAAAVCLTSIGLSFSGLSALWLAILALPGLLMAVPVLLRGRTRREPAHVGLVTLAAEPAISGVRVAVDEQEAALCEELPVPAEEVALRPAAQSTAL